MFLAHIFISSSIPFLLFNSTTDTWRDGHPPLCSHFLSVQSSLSLPSAGSWWLLVNRVLYSPHQFNLHCSSNSTIALSMGGRERRRGMISWLCVCLHALMCLHLWRVGTFPSTQIHPEREKWLATDKQCVGASSFCVLAALYFQLPLCIRRTLQNAPLSGSWKHAARKMFFSSIVSTRVEVRANVMIMAKGAS